jgi:DNA-binding HxlR family transcriptional regulator
MEVVFMSRSRPSVGFGQFNCPVEIPVEVLGGKWKAILVYHLLSGPQRNGELRRLLPAITQKMLTQQLRELEQDGIVIRTVHNEVPPKVVYTIDPGEAKPLRALMRAMCDWANYWASRTGAEIEHPISLTK